MLLRYSPETEAFPTMCSQQAMTACLIILGMKVIIIRINSTAYKSAYTHLSFVALFALLQTGPLFTESIYYCMNFLCHSINN